MTLADQDVPVAAWNEPDGLISRGTVVVIPGRGELPTVYERFGRRLASDAYRVRAVADLRPGRLQLACPAGAGRIGHRRFVRDHAGQIGPGC